MISMWYIESYTQFVFETQSQGAEHRSVMQVNMGALCFCPLNIPINLNNFIIRKFTAVEGLTSIKID